MKTPLSQQSPMLRLNRKPKVVSLIQSAQDAPFVKFPTILPGALNFIKLRVISEPFNSFSQFFLDYKAR